MRATPSRWRRLAAGLVATAVVAAVSACTGGPPPGSPFGSFDGVVTDFGSEWGDGGFWASGWAIDPDSNDPVDVHVYVDVRLHKISKADQHRPDVGAAYPGRGDHHGWVAWLSPLSGTHEVCVYAINLGPGENNLLGCRTETGHVPYGHVEVDANWPTGVRVRGWAHDVDTDGPVQVSVQLGYGTPVTVAASWGFPVGAGSSFPPQSAGHSFDIVLPATGSLDQRLTVRAHNVGPGVDQTIHERSAWRNQGTPYGEIDLYESTPSGVRVRGWAIDPDSNDPVDVVIEVTDLPDVHVPASLFRGDVLSRFPAAGPNHGFDVVVPQPHGRAIVCVIANNRFGQGSVGVLGCSEVTR